MKLTVLGCSGGIGGWHRRTTALLLDDDVLIDAGTGVAGLELEQLARIDHVFLTHSHLDHIACLPLMLDTIGDLRDRPVTVHATAETEEILRAHIFNWKIWPDFSEIPSRDKPYLRFETLRVGQAIALGGRTITALPANHTVPAVGYQIDSGSASLAFSGDTGSCAALWDALNRIDNLRYLIVETAFSNAERELAILSGHLCPELLHAELRLLRHAPEIFITHLKPAHAKLIMDEINANASTRHTSMLQTNQVLEF
ncbi:MAG: 3',5'-cyclic-nucleotide phosphodiesterase [Pseudomonadota bacterium]|nr:3',5'-cyclic-nucleotide phosphodiesterase [Pseudomonadota bacterium]